MAIVKAVIFDHDGTLANTEPIGERASVIFAARFGAGPFLHEHYIDLMGVVDYVARTQRIMDICGIVGDVMHLTAVRMEIFWEEFRRTVTLKPGALEIVSKAKDLGLPLAVASNSQKAYVTGSLKTFGILDRFDAIVNPEDLMQSTGKPDPEIYMVAASKLGIPPENTLVFEDSVAGLRSAKDAGAMVVFVPDARYGPTHHPDADMVISSLRDFNWQAVRIEGQQLGRKERSF